MRITELPYPEDDDSKPNNSTEPHDGEAPHAAPSPYPEQVTPPSFSELEQLSHLISESQDEDRWLKSSVNHLAARTSVCEVLGSLSSEDKSTARKNQGHRCYFELHIRAIAPRCSIWLSRAISRSNRSRHQPRSAELPSASRCQRHHRHTESGLQRRAPGHP